jgi:hypothetical protein
MTCLASQTDLFGQPGIRRTAEFRGRDRVVLRRWWAPGPQACIIGHNPSDADADSDDPTSKWWIRWCQHYGFGGYAAVNLYPFTSSNPKDCYAKVADIYAGLDWDARDALHFVNLPAVIREAKAAAQVFACWGALADRDPMWVEHVVEEIQSGAEPYPAIWCWGKTASGAPTHPMARGRHRINPLQPALLWRDA